MGGNRAFCVRHIILDEWPFRPRWFLVVYSYPKESLQTLNVIASSGMQCTCIFS